MDTPDRSSEGSDSEEQSSQRGFCHVCEQYLPLRCFDEADFTVCSRCAVLGQLLREIVPARVAAATAEMLYAECVAEEDAEREKHEKLERRGFDDVSETEPIMLASQLKPGEQQESAKRLARFLEVERTRNVEKAKQKEIKRIELEMRKDRQDLKEWIERRQIRGKRREEVRGYLEQRKTEQEAREQQKQEDRETVEAKLKMEARKSEMREERRRAERERIESTMRRDDEIVLLAQEELRAQRALEMKLAQTWRMAELTTQELFDQAVVFVIGKDTEMAYTFLGESLRRARLEGDRDIIEASLEGLEEVCIDLSLTDEASHYSKEANLIAGKSTRGLFDAGVRQVVFKDYRLAYNLLIASMLQARQERDDELIEANLDGLIEVCQELNLSEEQKRYSDELLRMRGDHLELRQRSEQLQERAKEDEEAKIREEDAMMKLMSPIELYEAGVRRAKDDWVFACKLFNAALERARLLCDHDSIEACVDALIDIYDRIDLNGEALHLSDETIQHAKTERTLIRIEAERISEERRTMLSMSAHALCDAGVTEVLGKNWLCAHKFLQESLRRERSSEENGDEELIETNLDGLAEICSELALFNEAQRYSQEAKDLREHRKQAQMTAQELFESGESLLVEKNLQAAHGLLKSAFDRARAEDDHNLVERSLDALIRVSEALNLDEELKRYMDEAFEAKAEQGKLAEESMEAAKVDLDVNFCVVCLDLQRTHLLVPCGHFSFCGTCVALLPKCPLCNADVVSNVKVYM